MRESKEKTPNPTNNTPLTGFIQPDQRRNYNSFLILAVKVPAKINGVTYPAV